MATTFLVLGMWGITQFMSGFGSITKETSASGGVAYMAHVGGFVAGLVIALIVRKMVREEPDSVLRRQYAADATAKRIW